MKRIKKISLILLTAILLVAATGVVLVTIYEEEVERFALAKLEQSLVTKVQVGDMDMTLWDKFPQASLVCNRVLIEETYAERDTLLFADRVYLQFNLFDFLGGDYIVRDLSIEDAELHIKRTIDGQDNYHFWKKTEGGGNFSFSLEGVSLSEVRTTIDDEKAEFAMDVLAKSISLDGLFAEETFTLDAIADLHFNTITVGENQFVAQKSVQVDCLADINAAESAYYITEGEIELEEIPFSATGTLMEVGEGMLCDLKIDGSDVEIRNILTHLPEAYKSSLVPYKADGDINFNGSISGLANKENHPDIRVEYKVEGATFTHLASGIAMSDINASGSFEKENGKPEKLAIAACTADFESGAFSTSGIVAEFARPWIDLELSGNFDLSDLRQFADLEAVDELNGQFVLNCHFEGKIEDPSSITKKDLDNAKVGGEMQFADALFQLKGAPHAFDNLRGKFSLSNKNATIHEFAGTVEESDFALDGTFSNFLPFLLIAEEGLSIDARFSSNHLDFNGLLADGASSSADYHLQFPKSINFNLDLSIDQFEFRKFTATAISGKATMKNQVLKLEPISLETADGTFLANASTDGREDNLFKLRCTADLKGMDVTALFIEFENFGQDFIRDEHLKGTAAANVHFTAELNSALEFNEDKIYTMADVTVTDGELINLTSMRSIAQYVKENPFVAPFVDEDALDEKLAHIQFATLENQIEIRDRKINLPKMEIISSAMDISASGNHSFDNKIDYTLGFKIRDIMSKDGDSEFGAVADDGLSNSFFLSMDGTSESPTFGYDRLAHKAKRKEDRQKESQNIKALLKEEVGLFKGDQTVGQYNDKTPKTTASITIAEEGDEPKVEKKGPKKKWKGFGKDDDKDEEVKISLDDDDDF